MNSWNDLEFSNDLADVETQRVETADNVYVYGTSKFGENYRRGKLALRIHGRFKFSDGGVCIIVWNPDG